MPWGLKRYYGTGDLHFITCSCYQRRPLLGTRHRHDLFLTVLEQVQRRYQFVVVGYVVMPEHFSRADILFSLHGIAVVIPIRPKSPARARGLDTSAKLLSA